MFEPAAGCARALADDVWTAFDGGVGVLVPARTCSRSRRFLPLPVLAVVALALALGLALLFGPALLRAATTETKLLASDAVTGDLLRASMSISGSPPDP